MTRSPWTPELDARLRAYWSEGLSCSQIGVALGVTRNAAIGRAHRLGLPTRSPGGKVKPRAQTKPLPKSRAPRPDLPGVDIMDLTPGMCRWPISDDRPHRFCGVACGSTYCLDHAAIAYPVQTVRKRIHPPLELSVRRTERDLMAWLRRAA